jgi:NADH:ubiquinone oxidoreductase subunit E
MNTHEILTDSLDFPEEKIAELHEYIDSIEDKEHMLIHILHKAQEIFGYLPPELQLHIARKLKIPASKVFGVVSFYSYFTQEKRGKHTISVCMGTACFVKGSGQMRDEISKSLQTDAHGNTKDGQFSLKELRCIGACGLAPALMVDQKVYGHINQDNVQTILQLYKED